MPSNFTKERQLTAQFVYVLRISIRSTVSTFACATLAEAVMRALECEHPHESHHHARGSGQASCRRQRKYEYDYLGPQQQWRWADGGETAYAAVGQQMQKFP